MTASGAERGKEGVALSSPGIKSQWTPPDLWHNKHLFWGVALLSIERYTDILWFQSLPVATTGSDPVWSTFWFRDESHWGTLKFTAPTLYPVDPELIMTVGTAHPPNINPLHSPAAGTQAQRAWPRMGVNNWHAGGCGRCWICQDASAVVLFIWSWESILHAAPPAVAKWISGIVYQKSGVLRVFIRHFHINISRNTEAHSRKVILNFGPKSWDVFKNF